MIVSVQTPSSYLLFTNNKFSTASPVARTTPGRCLDDFEFGGSFFHRYLPMFVVAFFCSRTSSAAAFLFTTIKHRMPPQLSAQTTTRLVDQKERAKHSRASLRQKRVHSCMCQKVDPDLVVVVRSCVFLSSSSSFITPSRPYLPWIGAP
jgi:hypothetical protein